MSKISIVGVEGSGKTTLMAAFGEKYERPDENGYGLKAANAQTFRLVRTLTVRMRQGHWPSANELGSLTNLDWTLYRREGTAIGNVCEVSFLDFAGEVYRKAFGDQPVEGPESQQIAALKEHIRSSDALVVLVNLKDIIDGDPASVRTIDMLWVSQRILDYAIDTCRIGHVALAFSQFDIYRETVEAAGGLRAAYAKYLPNIESIRPGLQLLALSAVDSTRVDEDGYEVPAPDYRPTGLEEVMAWIAGCAEKAAESKPVLGRGRPVLKRPSLLSPRWKWIRAILVGVAVVGLTTLITGAILESTGGKDPELSKLFSIIGFYALFCAVIANICLSCRWFFLRKAALALRNELAKQNKQVVAKIWEGGSRPGEEVTIRLPNAAEMTFCWCPATTSEDWKRISGGKDYFLMGSPEMEDGRDSDETQHRVTLTQGFWMGKYEVTQTQWESVMGSNPACSKGIDRPVGKVSWKDCQEFVRKVNVVEEVSVALPTEAQWEYACRAGTTTPFSFGSSLNGDKANCDGNYPYGATSKGRYRGTTMPVGSYEPNDWGLYDMHGNVWEWCADWYGPYDGDATDPTGPALSCARRVLRGGSWIDLAQFCRSANRNGGRPGYRGDDLGFRLVCFAGPRR